MTDGSRAAHDRREVTRVETIPPGDNRSNYRLVRMTLLESRAGVDMRRGQRQNAEPLRLELRTQQFDRRDDVPSFGLPPSHHNTK